MELWGFSSLFRSPSSWWVHVVESSEPPRRLVSRIDSGELPFGGAWTAALESREGGGTRVTIAEAAELYNPIFRCVSRFIIGHTATMETYLAALAGRLATTPSTR